MNELKQLIDSDRPEEAWNRLRRLLRHSPDYRTLTTLGREARAMEAKWGAPKTATELKLAVVGGATTEMLVPPLRSLLVGFDIRPEIFTGAYNHWVPELLDPDGELAAFQPRAVLVATTLQNVSGWPTPGASLEDVEGLIDEACESLLRPCRTFHERSGSEIILNNFHVPPQRALGNLGAKLPWDPVNFIRRLNVALGDRAPDYVHLCDVASMTERRGLEGFLDLRLWYHAKQPVSFDALPDYLRNVASIMATIVGRTHKLVAVDLDNTLWGGIVGDDGIDGIEIGEGTALGEAFKNFQVYLRSLRDRGVLLAVCSKNDEKIARETFRKRSDMVLTEEDFVAFKANWNPKSENLRALAKELNLGLRDFVFVDDNPAEREQIRQAVDQVTVPEIGDDPTDYPRLLEEGRYFEIVSLTDEDRERTEAYSRRKAAAQAMESADDLSSYWASLEMHGSIRPFEEGSLERITQLTNKTNQFNLTTRRTTLSEIKAMVSDPSYVTRSVRLGDRFGDHGLISVFWARQEGDLLHVDSWLMSCRVIKRGVPAALFNHLLDVAKQRGIREIVGVYIPTERNGLVRDHYADLGFEPDGEPDASGQTRWKLQVADARPQTVFIEIDTQ